MQSDRGPLGPDEVVVVAGVPRSGTSLLMQMLEAGGIPPLCDDSRPADVDNPRGYYELAAAKRLARDASWLEDARGRAVKVVHALVPKLPSHFSYRVILTERRMDEVLTSQERMLERLAGRTGAAGEVLPAERLAEIFSGQLEAAARWLDAQPNLRWLRVRHAELIGDPGVSAEALADFLGGRPDPQAMAAVVDPALYRVRASQPPADERTGR